MIETHLNIFDVAVLGVMALSCLFAFFRGFVREVLSLGAWIGAAVVTMYYFPDVAERLRPHFKNAIGAAGVGTLIIYTTALICFSIINSIILKYVKSGTEVGMLDNAMGFIFGLARGGLIISLGYFLMSIAMPEKEYPDWLKKSMTRPYAEMGAIKLAKVAPEYLREISSLEKKAVSEIQAAKTDAAEQEDIEIKEKPKDAAGYSRASTSALDRLLGSSSGKKE